MVIALAEVIFSGITLVYQFGCGYKAAPVGTQGDTGDEGKFAAIFVLGQNIYLVGLDLPSGADDIFISY